MYAVISTSVIIKLKPSSALCKYTTSSKDPKENISEKRSVHQVGRFFLQKAFYKVKE